jgi:hypothetical protein
MESARTLPTANAQKLRKTGGSGNKRLKMKFCSQSSNTPHLILPFVKPIMINTAAKQSEHRNSDNQKQASKKWHRTLDHQGKLHPEALVMATILPRPEH